MSVLNQSGEEQVECPLCLEPLEVDDLHFYPCTCGYQICRFCWNRIRETENGLCPACRKAYPENPADFTPLSQEEVAAMKTEKRAREQKRRNKTLESRRQLANVRVVQNNLVFVVGLPSRLADPEILKKQEYFGKYGKIHKVVINQTTAYAGSQGPCASAYVTYTTSADALRAIQAVNNVTIDGRQLKGSLGTTKYCANFMKNQTCPKLDCMYLHDLGDPKASFTKEEMHQCLHQIYERKLHNALLAQDQANKIAQANGTATNGTDKNSNIKDGNPSFIPTTIVTSSSLGDSNQSSSLSSSQSTSSSNGSAPPLSSSKEAWPSLSSSPPVSDISTSVSAAINSAKSKGKNNNREQSTSQQTSDTNGTSKSNSESNHKNPGKTKDTKNKSKGDKQKTKQNNKTVSICSENDDLPLFTNVTTSVTNKTSAITSNIEQTDVPTVINNSVDEENFVNATDIQDSFVTADLQESFRTADLQESFLNNDSFVNSASLDSDERHSLLENHDLILDNEDNHSLLEDDAHNLLNDEPGLDSSNLLMMRHQNMLARERDLADRHLVTAGQHGAEAFGLIDSSNNMDYMLTRERYQTEILLRQNELLARQQANQQRNNLLGDNSKHYLGSNYHQNTSVLPPFGMRMDGSVPAMSQNFMSHNNVPNGFPQSQGHTHPHSHTHPQAQAESEGTRYIGESGMDKFITDFHKNQQMKMYMQQTQDSTSVPVQNSHNMPGQNIQNGQNMLAQNIQQNTQNMLSQNQHNMQNSQHTIGQNVQQSQQNVLGQNAQNAQNVLGQNAHNVLGQNAQNMLGHNAQNILGQNAQNMLGQHAQNILGQNAQNMLGQNIQNSQNMGYGQYQQSDMQTQSFLESRLRKYGEGHNEMHNQIQQQVHEDKADISRHSLSEKISSSMVDDDLDFDPFKETQKALAEMMESEQMGQQNGKIGADLADRLGSRTASRMPPPGFSHMNAFGLGVPRPQQASAPGFSTPASMITDWTQIDPAIVSTSVGGFPHKTQMMQQPNFPNPQQNQELYNRFNQSLNIGNQPLKSGNNGVNQNISKILQNAQHNPVMALAQIQQQLTLQNQHKFGSQQQNGMVHGGPPQLQNGQNGQYLQLQHMQNQQKLPSVMLQQSQQNINGWNLNVLPPNYNMAINGSSNVLYGAQMLVSNGSLENKQYSMPIPPGFSNLPSQNSSKNGNMPTECIESK